MQRTFTPREIEQFIDLGYVVVRGVIPPHIVESSRRGIWEILKRNPDDPATWPTQPVMVTPEAYAATVPCRTAAIDALVQQLVGPLISDGHGYFPVLNFPRPGPRQWSPLKGGSHIDGHPDKPLWPSDRYVVILAYLTDTTEHGGAVHIRPGSHRDVFAHYYTTGNFGPLEATPPDIRYRHDATPIPGKAGDAVLFHYLMVHGSSHNYDHHVREALNSCVVPHPRYAYQRKDGPPRDDWTPLDHTLRTDNLPAPVSPLPS